MSVPEGDAIWPDEGLPDEIEQQDDGEDEEE
jgi:hypothetical protein